LFPKLSKIIFIDVFYSFENKVEHYRVILKNNRVTVDEEEYFENLVKLVEVSITDIISQYFALSYFSMHVALSERS